MDRDEPVPEADAIEQSDEDSEDVPQLPRDMPEADVLEQKRAVDEVRTRIVPPARGDVPEADWLEQSAVEPVEDDEPR